jgi:uncharacterized protein YndB with AHSA1/START domain
MAVRSDRRYRFAVGRREVWQAFTQVDQYRRWWPWLHRFDGVEFRTGERWECAVKAQLPYTLEFAIELDDVAEDLSAHARLSGDIDGWAELTLTDEGTGSQLRMESVLTARSGPARWLDAVAPPLARRGHDWILDNGIRQFRRATGV